MSDLLEIRRLTPALGAEIHGLELRRPLSSDQASALRAALVEHQVLFFRDQELSPAEHLRLARVFGEVEIHPAYPHVPGFPEIAVLEADRDRPSKIELWHTDMTFRPNPPRASVLRAVAVPEGRGDTLWMSLEAALRTLPDGVRRRIDGLRAEHSFEHGFRESLAEPGGRQRLAAALRANPPVVHPVVRTHPVSGRCSLFVNRLFTTRILGLEPGESAALLERLFSHCERSELQVRFRWRRGSIAIWDNRSTQHRPVNDYWPAHRRMERVTIAGDVPF